jgi:hypothetical protein
MKRLLSCLIAVALLIALSVPICADDYMPATETSLAPESADEPILNVLVPVDIDFTIDPFELAGRGQVYSEPVEFINHGETDVILTITDLAVTFANDTDFETVAAPFGEEYSSDKKAICLLLNFESAYSSAVSITDDCSPVSFALNARGSAERNSCTLSVSGAVNPYPAVKWRDGEVKISLTYQMEPQNTDPEPPDAKEGENSETVYETDDDTIVLPDITLTPQGGTIP